MVHGRCVVEKYEYARECVIIDADECQDFDLCEKTLLYNVFSCPQFRCYQDETSTTEKRAVTETTTDIPTILTSTLPMVSETTRMTTTTAELLSEVATVTIPVATPTAELVSKTKVSVFPSTNFTATDILIFSQQCLGSQRL